MKVITAPLQPVLEENDISCFLAGGITGCWNWQEKVIECLEQYKGTENLIIFNPRRETFDVTNQDAAFEQIKWEFDALQKADIFSMYFCGGESDHPICMYELGRNLMAKTYDDVVVSIEPGYRRAQDVIIQMELALNGKNQAHVYATPESHASEIMKIYNRRLKTGF